VSYARKTSGDGDGPPSDVYIINNGSSLECVNCCLVGEYEPTFFVDLALFFRHLDEHTRAGDKIPWYTRPTVYRDWSDGAFSHWDQTRVEDMLPYARAFTYGQSGQEGV